MVTWNQTVAFVPVAAALLVVPGPSVLFVVSRGVELGKRAAVASVAGNELGTCCHLFAAAAGIGALVQRSMAVFTTIKLAGAAYLIYLGVRAIRRRHRPADEHQTQRAPRSTRRLIADGFVVGVSNPKSTLFFVAVLPQFVVPERGDVTLQLLSLGLLFILLAVVNDLVYGIAAGSVRDRVIGSSRRGGAVREASGLLMIALGLRVATTGHTD